MKFLKLSILMGCMGMFAAGCGDNNPETFPVTGKVTLDGKGLEGATVTFVGEKPENSAATTTKADGSYELATFKAGDGALPGTYKIMVTKYNKGAEVSPYDAPDTGSAPVEQTPETISAAYSKGYSGPPKAGWKPPVVTNEVPIKYASVATSGLTFMVEKKPNTFDIPMKSK